MFTVTVEMRRRPDDGEQAMRVLEAVGARRLPGYRPIPMKPATAGAPPTVVITVSVPDAKTVEDISALPDVVEVFGDPTISPF
jgi:hypothetical protein